jgi:hypothetical protein
MLSLLIAALSAPVAADEGMWQPADLPEFSDHLAELGLKLPAAEFARLDGAPLGAIVSLGHCSGSFVSADGLVATNGHCVRRWLSFASEPGIDRVRDGVIALDPAGEIWAGPSARIRVMESSEDVTAAVLAGVGKRTKDAQRAITVERNRKELVADCEADSDFRCSVESFHGGLEYRLIVMREMRDVRLVYVPPDEVVFFGGETDNWMWPRHNGDFALVRVYVGPNGRAASHSAENTPYKSPAHLELDPSGVSSGDFVAIAGFPGTTSRNLTAAEIRYAQQIRYPAGLSIFNDLLAIFEQASKIDPIAEQKLGPIRFSLENLRKNYEGMLDNFTSSDMAARRTAEEAELRAWIAKDKSRKKRYGTALEDLEAEINAWQSHSERDRLVRMTGWSPQLLRTARTGARLALEREKADAARRLGYQARDEQAIADRFATLERTLYLSAEEDVVAWLLKRSQDLPEDQRIVPLDTWMAQVGTIPAGLELLFEDPALATVEGRDALLSASLADLKASEDPWIQLALSLELWLDEQEPSRRAHEGAMLRLRPQYHRARIEKGDGPVYADANGTLRVSVGKVQGYSPAEAVVYTPQTSLNGLVAKATDQGDFRLSDGFLDRVEGATGSRWIDAALGQVPVNFLSDLDNTGGSSGSATLNAQGQLVGLVFDRNYEAMAADWQYVPELNRSIHADIRYLLWLLETTDGAAWLLSELGVE